ncbi:10885_t:CDS:2 [Entrophospora sp. SA101]|nr:10885_t:CDS:2 [Entrophospora sp. SA101]
MTLEDGIKLHEDKSETPSPQLSKSPPSAPISKLQYIFGCGLKKIFN